MLDLADAEPEAAHLVVGCALGLKLKRAFVRRQYDKDLKALVDGITYFSGFERRKLAFGIMACAGLAYERKINRGADHYASGDIKLARMCFSSLHDIEVGVKLARELLDGRRRLHARVASELCDRDLGPADIELLVVEHG